MRSAIFPLALLVLGTPLLAQVQPLPAPVQSRTTTPVQGRTDIPVNNPTTMQLRVEIQQLEAKIDDLTSVVEEQGKAMAALGGNISSLQSSIAEFRAASDAQYKKLRTTSFLDCYQTAANSTWGYGDGDIAVRHCTGELGPVDLVPF